MREGVGQLKDMSLEEAIDDRVKEVIKDMLEKGRYIIMED